MAETAVLVTGAYGLIGHAAVLSLRRAGWPVVATDRNETRPSDALFEALPLTVNGVDKLSNVLAEHGISTIVHAAGISGPMLAQGTPHEVFRVNAGGTLDLFEAARRIGVRRVVLLSSASVYGRTEHVMVDEATPLRAIGTYGASKIAGECAARAYAAEHGVEVVILRPCWVYGPRRRTACVIRTMIDNALQGRPTRLGYGRGFPRQFVHVDDVAEAVLSSISAPAAVGHAINLSDGSWRTLDEVAGLVGAVLPAARILLADVPAPDDEFLGPLSLTRAALSLDWQPRTDLETGIRSYKQHLSADIAECLRPAT